jgi:hydrogenase-4 component B
MTTGTALVALAAALGVAGVPLAARRRIATAVTPAVGAVLWLAVVVSALSAFSHPAPLIRLPLPEGLLVFRGSPWTGFWGIVVAMLAGTTGAVLLAERRAPGAWIAWSWTLLAAEALIAAGSPFTLVLSFGVLALAVYGLVASGATNSDTLHVAWVMLVMNEFGAVLLLVAAVAAPAGHALAPGMQAILALLGVVGLGAKAGLFPFQLWLPVAEPEAPGSVAGMLSGTLTLVTMLAIWAWLSWFGSALLVIGWVLVVLGLTGALLGMIHAVVDRDGKRVLAYSTAEWMGVAFTALGLVGVFRQDHLPAAAGLAEFSFFFVILAHAAAKSAVFTTTEWIERQAGTRALDHLGGLLKIAPGPGVAAGLASAALMAVPPTGGFLAEWMLAECVFMGAAGAERPAFLAVAAVLALVLAGGATALLRWYGAAFLGPVRRRPAGPPGIAYGIAAWTGAALAWVAGIGVAWLAPWWAAVAPRLSHVSPLSPIAPTFTAHPGAAAALIPLGGRWFSGLPGLSGVILFPGPAFTVGAPWDLFWVAGVITLVVLVVRRLAGRRAGQSARVVPVWGGGVPPRAEEAWTASGLTLPLRLAFAPVIGLRRARTREGGALQVQVDVVDRLVEQAFEPALQAARRLAGSLKRLQNGQLSRYLVLMLAALLLLLVLSKA